MENIMLKRYTAILMIACMLLVIGCATHVHKVGNGAQGNDTTEARQWYILWGTRTNQRSRYKRHGRWGK